MNLAAIEDQNRGIVNALKARSEGLTLLEIRQVKNVETSTDVFEVVTPYGLMIGALFSLSEAFDVVQWIIDHKLKPGTMQPLYFGPTGGVFVHQVISAIQRGAMVKG